MALESTGYVCAHWRDSNRDALSYKEQTEPTSLLSLYYLANSPPLLTLPVIFLRSWVSVILSLVTKQLLSVEKLSITFPCYTLCVYAPVYITEYNTNLFMITRYLELLSDCDRKIMSPKGGTAFCGLEPREQN